MLQMLLWPSSAKEYESLNLSYFDNRICNLTQNLIFLHAFSMYSKVVGEMQKSPYMVVAIDNLHCIFKTHHTHNRLPHATIFTYKNIQAVNLISIPWFFF